MILLLTKEQKLKKINADPILWLKNFVKIIDNEGNNIKFETNDQQQEFIKSMGKFNIIAKARQLGFSTMSLGLCLYYACNKPNTNYMIVSYKQDSSDSLFNKLKMMYETLPHDKYKFPKVVHNNKGVFRLGNGSSISCVVSGNKDVGRGSTYQYILLSEFAFYSNQERTLLSAEQSLAKNEESRVVIETTSNGFNAYQKVFSKAWHKESKYKAFFFPWFSSGYKKQFSYDYTIAEAWYKEKYGRRLQSKDLEDDEKVLYENGASLKQLMWRQWKLQDMEIDEFYQEYPSTWLESFISTGLNVFDNTKVVARLNHITPPLNKKVLQLELPEILRQYIGKGLDVFSLPKPKERYYAGIDTSGGYGGDDSTISIFNKEGQQVLSFYHNRTPIYKLAQIADCIGRYYNYAFLVVERNRDGLSLLERLRREYGYINLYKQQIFNQKGQRQTQLGFLTTQISKSVLIADFKEYFEIGLLNIECEKTLEEMQVFVEDDKGGMGNKTGSSYKDDLVISSALACQGIKTNKWYVA
jgi:Terminase large subunit, T4likevirus-type, N-terminal